MLLVSLKVMHVPLVVPLCLVDLADSSMGMCQVSISILMAKSQGVKAMQNTQS